MLRLKHQYSILSQLNLLSKVHFYKIEPIQKNLKICNKYFIYQFVCKIIKENKNKYPTFTSMY